VILFDIPDNGGFYLGEFNDVSTANVETLIQAKESGALKRRQLSR